MTDAQPYHARTHWLPDRRQSYLHLPGVRPDRGPCPGCSAPEDEFCASECDLNDPYAGYNHAARTRRCHVCDYATDFQPRNHATTVLVLDGRAVRHLPKGEGTPCWPHPRAYHSVVSVW